MNVDDDVLDAEGVATLLQLHRVTVRRLAAHGEIPGRKVGRGWRFSRAAILQSLSESSEHRPLEGEPRSVPSMQQRSTRRASAAISATPQSDPLLSRRTEKRFASMMAVRNEDSSSERSGLTQATSQKPRIEMLARDVESIHEPGTYCCGEGLYLQVGRSGSQSWIFRFKLSGRAREMGMGALSSVSLTEAREHAIECRKLLEAGVDPLEARGGAQRPGVRAAAQVIPIKPRR